MKNQSIILQYLFNVSTIFRGGDVMIIQYNTAQLRRLIENLFDLVGVSLSVLDTDYRILTHCSRKDDFCSLLQRTGDAAENCRNCDMAILKKCSRSKKLEGHICAAGLYDCAMPIIKYDTIVGFVIMGRIRSAKSPLVPGNIPEMDPETRNGLMQKYEKIPIMTQKQLTALYDLLPSILFDSAIRIVYDPLANKLAQYIEANLRDDLSVSSLCDRFHISANRLYNTFRKNFDRTVSDYITDQRLKRAKEMLTDSDEPVYIIAESVGISNYTYFCKLFKKRSGCTPVQFRNDSKGVGKADCCKK